jgi:hypothetical protein
MRLAFLGDLPQGEYSEEVIVEDDSISELYFFTDYSGIVRLDDVYILKKNRKNIFDLSAKYTKGIRVTDREDPTQYPQ